MIVFIQAIVLVILALLGAVGLFFFFRARERGKLLGSFDMSLFLVLMPKYDIKADDLMQKAEKELISHMEQVFANFLYLRNPPILKRLIMGKARVAFEVASQTGGSDIEFYVAVPKYLEGGLEKYIQGVYPRAIVEKIPKDYTIFEPDVVSVGARVRLESFPIFPIDTYQSLEKDPLAMMSNAFSKISENEGAALQVVISPVNQRRWREIGDKVLANIQQGKTLYESVGVASRSPIADITLEVAKELTMSAEKKQEQQQRKQQRIEPEVDQRTIDAIQRKIKKQVFQVNIRLVSSAATKERADEILWDIAGAFGQFAVSAFNSFEIEETAGRGLKRFLYDFVFRNFHADRRNILNLEELASLYHFPTKYMETPYVKMAKSTTVAAPPSELAESGTNIIGKVNFRGEERHVAFATREDRRRHFYIIGQTGTGKSSLLREMIRQDVQNGEGTAVIDPHGELIEATLANIPKERAEDLVLFEPFHMDRPMGLNMLEYETPEQKDFAVQEMISIFHKLFPPEIIGPMFEHYMRNAMLALMADRANPGTLVEIPRMFTDEAFMESRLRGVEDHMVRNFWLKEWKQMTGSTKSDMLGYMVSKVGRFIENEMMRNIIGQAHSSFNLGDIMNEKKIFLANLSKGSTGEVNSSLLGLILVSKIQMAAMRRATIAEEERNDFYLYIDEFQNFTTDSIASILSEARKYRLNLIMAHQYVPQLTEDIRNAVVGNVGTMASFRIGAEDARFLETQFKPEFSEFDLVNLDNFHLVVKMLVRSKVSSAFEMETVPPDPGNPQIVNELKNLARMKYGRPKDVVGSEIAQRSGI